jgi:hypothetical protein
METHKTKVEAQIEPKISKEKCGIIMPISSLDGCTEQHWTDVKSILYEAIDLSGFDANLVSNADDVGIIQKTIIQNIYDNPIIVCDVSGKNPNVMFELGIRLAFDKPTIIVKDDKTSYSFDTSPIEHLTYPRDLRFNKIVEFKSELSEKIIATVKKSREDKDFSTFLKHFGKFTVAKLDTTEVSKEQYIIEELRDLKLCMQKFMQRDLNQRQRYIELDNMEHSMCEDAIMLALRHILTKYEGNSLKDLSNPKMKKVLLNQLATTKSMPPCFELNNSVCIDKVYNAVDKMAISNFRYKS